MQRLRGFPEISVGQFSISHPVAKKEGPDGDGVVASGDQAVMECVRPMSTLLVPGDGLGAGFHRQARPSVPGAAGSDALDQSDTPAEGSLAVSLFQHCPRARRARNRAQTRLSAGCLPGGHAKSAAEARHEHVGVLADSGAQVGCSKVACVLGALKEKVTCLLADADRVVSTSALGVRSPRSGCQWVRSLPAADGHLLLVLARQPWRPRARPARPGTRRTSHRTHVQGAQQAEARTSAPQRQC